MKRLFLIGLILVSITSSSGQTFDELLFPKKSVVRKAESLADSLLSMIKDSLDLTNKNVKLKNFELVPCEALLSASAEKGIFEDASGFIKKGACPNIYSYSHRTNKVGTFYRIDMEFDFVGSLRKRTVELILVTY